MVNELPKRNVVRETRFAAVPRNPAEIRHSEWNVFGRAAYLYKNARKSLV